MFHRGDAKTPAVTTAARRRLTRPGDNPLPGAGYVDVLHSSRRRARICRPFSGLQVCNNIAAVALDYVAAQLCSGNSTFDRMFHQN